MKKLLFVFGTRPEAIKMCPLIINFQKYPDLFEVSICVTAQHREMLDQVLQIFCLKPNYDLDIMEPGQDLYDISSKVLLRFRDVLKELQPHFVFVHGDTTTSTFAAIASYYQQISVVHVEAGLRTNNIYSPFPEEINRQISSRIAAYHLAPTTESKANLLLENVDPSKIIVTGNTVIDSLLWALEKIKNNIFMLQGIKKSLIESGCSEDFLNFDRKFVLITGHRRENFGDKFSNICEAIKDLAIKYKEIDFIYPVHLNPNVQEPVHTILGIGKLKNIQLLKPLEYLTFVYLMSKSYFVLTDSGGIQEEAPGIGKPVLVTRDTTERPESVMSGTVKLVGTSYDTIMSSVSMLIDDDKEYQKMSTSANPYGDGTACVKIVDFFSSICT